MKKLLLTVCASALFSAPAFAQKPAVVVNDKAGWHKIAETTVDFQKERDEVAVLIADKFASLKFKVSGAPIELLDIDVFFTEGDNQNIIIGTAIKQDGSESRPIDLKGGAERSIKRIAFHYRTIESKSDKKGKLEIWGKKTNAGNNEDRAGDNRNSNGMKENARDVKNEARETGRDVKEGAGEVKRDAKQGMGEVKKEANQEKREMKEETREERKDAKAATREADNEAKQEGRELKKDAKKTEKKAEKKVKKEAKEVKKDAKEARDDVKQEMN